MVKARNRRFSALLFAIWCTLASSSAFSQAISLPVYEELQKVQESIEAENYVQAEDRLRRMLETRRRLNNYERAQAWSLWGSLYIQMEDYEQALAAFATAVDFDDLPLGFTLTALRTLAQLSFMQEQLPEARDYTRRLIELTEVPDANHYALLAQIYYRMDDFAGALTEMRRAIELERERDRIPSENWLLVLNAIYYSLNDFESIVPVLEELMVHYPKQRYVLNLAAIYGQLEQTDKQLLLMEPLFDKQLLNRETELVNLANLMMLHRVPYKAARVLEQGLEQGNVRPSQRNWEMLAQSWQMAAEDDRALAALAEAAELDDEGNTSFRLAQSYINLYRWPEAERALMAALEKGALRRPGDAQLLLGMVRFNQQDYRNARQAFHAAEDYDQTVRLAEQWLVYLEQEMAKQEALHDE